MRFIRWKSTDTAEKNAAESVHLKWAKISSQSCKILQTFIRMVRCNLVPSNIQTSVKLIFLTLQSYLFIRFQHIPTNCLFYHLIRLSFQCSSQMFTNWSISKDETTMEGSMLLVKIKFRIKLGFLSPQMILNFLLWFPLPPNPNHRDANLWKSRIWRPFFWHPPCPPPKISMTSPLQPRPLTPSPLPWAQFDLVPKWLRTQSRMRPSQFTFMIVMAK